MSGRETNTTQATSGSNPGHNIANALDGIRRLQELPPTGFASLWGSPLLPLLLPGCVSSGPDDAPSAESTSPPPLYPYALRRGDFDQDASGAKQFFYEGAERSTANGDTVPDSATAGYVKDLQDLLKTLGFAIVDRDTSGIFGWYTFFALREFQIYAHWENLAQAPAALDATKTSLSEQYTVVVNTQEYNGPVSGVANADTQIALKAWRDNRWRCPVLVEAWNMNSTTGRTAIYQDNSINKNNLWHFNDVTSSTPRMFARDFSERYTLTATQTAETVNNPGTSGSASTPPFVVVGDYAKYLTWSGPRSAPSYDHCWEDSAITAEKLIGKAWGDLTDPQKSTYKMVRAVSETECFGQFDSINAYDDAAVSIGPCHWTLCQLGLGTPYQGEFMPFLAYFEKKFPAVFQQTVGQWGIRATHQGEKQNHQDDTAETWGTDGGAFDNWAQRKMEGWIAFQNEQGDYDPLDKGQNLDAKQSANQPVTSAERTRDQQVKADTKAITAYFRSWHMFYRLMMLARTVSEFQQSMWGYSRIRLQGILEAKWDTGSTRTIGDYFKSEKSAALLTRWHIKYPSDVLSSGKATSKLRKLVTDANFSNSDPSAWGDTEEATLITALETALKGKKSDKNWKDQVDKILNWQSEAADTGGNAVSLSGGYNTRKLDLTDLDSPF